LVLNLNWWNEDISPDGPNTQGNKSRELEMYVGPSTVWSESMELVTHAGPSTGNAYAYYQNQEAPGAPGILYMDDGEDNSFGHFGSYN
jgi:hypothetical protein